MALCLSVCVLCGGSVCVCVLCGGHKPLPTRRLLLWPLRWAPLQGNHLHSPQTGRYARAALRGSPGQSERGHTKLKVENPAVCSPDAGMRADPLLCSASLALRFSRALEAPERLGAWMDLDLPLLAQPVGWPWEALREHVLGHYPNVCLGETPVMSDPPEANTHPQLLFQVGAPGHTGSRVPARSTSVCGEGGRGQGFPPKFASRCADLSALPTRSLWGCTLHRCNCPRT